MLDMKKKKIQEFPSYPPLYFVRITQKMRHFFLKMNRRFTHPNVVLWEMAQNMWLAAGISVAAELGIADLLKQGPKKVAELASLTKTHSDSLYRVLRMLASHGIFKEGKGKGKEFEITALAVPLQEDQIRYLMLVHLNRNQFQLFGGLMESVRSGLTVKEELSGKALFDHIGNDARKNEWFNKAMSSASKMQVPALLSAFPFKKYDKIIDLGGGEAYFLSNILRKAKNSRGVVFDLPAVLEGLGAKLEDPSMGGRLEMFQGDFFEDVPSGGDLYILKSILHDWDENKAIQILKNIHRVMGQNARLLIIETVLDEGNHPSFGKMTDILMMVAAGGKERTLKQWEHLLSASGFKIRKIRDTITPHSIIEVTKN